MDILFDAIIVGFLSIDAVLGILLIVKLRRQKRRSATPVLLLGICVITWAVVFYGSFIEPQLIVITKQSISLEPENVDESLPPARLRVAFMSDPHIGPYKKTEFIKRVVEKTNALSPDLILLGGDYLSKVPAHPEYLAPLADLKAPYGIYGIYGNHDYGETSEEIRNPNIETNLRFTELRKVLATAGVRMLVNDRIEITLSNSQVITIGGVDDLWTGRSDIAKTFAGAANGVKILLAHNPDIIYEAEKAGVSLVLAAHTHGGQIRLPFIGAVAPIPTELGHRYDRGLFSFGQTKLFITSGLGESGPRARLLVPPEIALLEVQF